MRILLLHASAGSGHRRAAEALAQAFSRQDRAHETVVVDILDYTPPVFRRTYGRGYLRIVRKVPELWGYMYERSDRKSRHPWRKHVRSAFNQINAGEFFEFYDRSRPDVAVCTHFMPLELLSSRVRRKQTAAPFCCVTDFAVHSLWMVDQVAHYYVATEEARRHLVRLGQPADRIQVTGIPIDQAFASGRPAPEARQALGLDPDRPTALVLSGGFGVGPAVELLAAFRSEPWEGQLLVVAGSNEKLREQAEATARDLAMPVRVFGFVDNMHELMDAADLVVSKPGGLTSSEVLAKGKPLLIVDPIPGQEQRNCEHLLEAGAAARLFELADAPYKIASLLGDPERLAAMQRRARDLGRPDAADRIVSSITTAIGNGSGAG